MNPLSGGSIPNHEKELAFLTKGGETATEVALRFNITSPEITITLVGFGSNHDIDETCRIADESKPFTQEDFHKLKNLLGENMNKICTGCGYCRVCPKGINIPGYMLFYNEKQMFKKSDEEMIQSVYGLEYWNYSMSNKKFAAECVKCGKCLEECTQHLPIIDRLKQIAEWEEKGTNDVTV